MGTADRYILREILAPFLLGVGGFIVLLAGDVVYTLADFVATKRITLDVLLKLLAYKLPAIFVITFPVSTLFGVLLGLARLAKDRELQAMRLAGISLTRIFVPVLLFGAVAGAVAFLTNEYFTPWANQRANGLLRRAAFSDAAPPVRQRIFFRGPGDRVFYVERADAQARALYNVMVYEPAGPLPRLITARQAAWEGRTLRLVDGVVREFDTQGFTRYEARFAGMDIALNVDGAALLAGQRTPDEMTARELRQYLAVFGQESSAAAFVVELHRRFAVPLAAVVFALLAAPLSVYAAQGGRFLGVGLTVVVLFCYYAVMSVGRAMGTTGGMTPGLAAWLPNLIFAAGGALLWARADGWRLFAPAAAGAKREPAV